MKRNLTCGCCGCGFRTWPEYVDQDQDKGFGICKDCQGWIEDRDNVEDDKAIALLRSALNDANRAVFDAMDRDLQMGMVGEAINAGFITFSIRSA